MRSSFQKSSRHLRASQRGNFQTHAKDRYILIICVNNNNVNTTRPHWLSPSIYLSQCSSRSMSLYGVTTPQWVDVNTHKHLPIHSGDSITLCDVIRFRNIMLIDQVNKIETLFVDFLCLFQSHCGKSRVNAGLVRKNLPNGILFYNHGIINAVLRLIHFCLLCNKWNMTRHSMPGSKVHGAQLGPTGPRWAPCWPHEPCYLGSHPQHSWR